MVLGLSFHMLAVISSPDFFLFPTLCDAMSYFLFTCALLLLLKCAAG